MIELTQRDIDWRLEVARERLAAVGTTNAAAESFLENYRRLLHGEQTMIPEADITPVDRLPRLHEQWGNPDTGRRELQKLVVVKLAGGLGTSMGLDVPKALLPVKEGQTFLDLTLRQIRHLRERYRSDVPVLLMCSFATQAALENALRQADVPVGNPHGLPPLFAQNRVPKIIADTLEPVRTALNDPSGWYPPGHGDIYTVMWQRGILERLLSQGYRYAFVSNIDNLGATVDLRLVGYMAESGVPFLMEAAERTAADRKGGHLARDAKGRLLLRESGQCPPEDFHLFQDVGRHRYFNTNNLWLNLEAIETALRDSKGRLPLPVIVNRKSLNPQNPLSMPVFHLETAAGAALSIFEGAAAVAVPRARFLPVKTTDDLLAMRSDIYLLAPDSTLRVNPERRLETVVIDLDHRVYGRLPEFDARFPSGPPSLVRCRSLTIEGDFLFRGRVVLEGSVYLRNRSCRQILVPAKSLISGSRTK